MELKKSHSIGSFFKKSHKDEAPAATVDENGEEDLMAKDVSLASFFGPFMKNYAATLGSSKGNPAKIPYPPRFYIPQSSLQLTMSTRMKHIGLLEMATQQPDPMNRFLCVIKYFFSNVNVTKFPYKPIIAMEGETAHNFVNHSTSRTSAIGEEIVHDPPHCAFYICNADKGFSYTGNVLLEPNFSKGSVRVKLAGFNRIVLRDPQGRFAEEYNLGNPDLLVKMLRLSTEMVGEVIITSSTGFSARLTFKEKPLFGGAKNGITGVIMLNNAEIAHLDGTWDETIFITDLSNKVRSEFINRKGGLPMDKVEHPPIETLPETSGERVWGSFIELLRTENFAEAQTWKLNRNAAERAEREARHAAGVQPALFAKNTMTGWWEPKDPAAVCGKSAA